MHKAVPNKKRLFFQKLYSIVCMMLGLCASLRCDCLTSNWQKEPCSRICREMRLPPPPADCPTYPLHPFSSPPSPPPSHNFPSSPHHPPPFSHHHLLFFIIPLLFLLLQEVWKASRLSILACRDLWDRHWNVYIQVWSPPPPGSKIFIGSR